MKNLNSKSKLKPVQQMPSDISKTPLQVEKNIKMLQGQADSGIVKRVTEFVKTFGRKN